MDYLFFSNNNLFCLILALGKDIFIGSFNNPPNSLIYSPKFTNNE